MTVIFSSNTYHGKMVTILSGVQLRKHVLPIKQYTVFYITVYIYTKDTEVLKSKGLHVAIFPMQIPKLVKRYVIALWTQLNKFITEEGHLMLPISTSLTPQTFM